jgi:hypothetical protein
MKKFPLGSALIPGNLYQRGMRKIFRYSGASMQPTFKPGQLLYVRPDVEDIKPGDVLVYREKDRYIVHRVLGMKDNAFITRGDNNPSTDRHPIQRNQVVGRVEINENQDWAKPVKNGQEGLWQAHLVSFYKKLDPKIRLFFGWPYRMLKRSKLISIIWKPHIDRLCLKSDHGIILKYIYQYKTVATWDETRGQFNCKRPFDLVIPVPEHKG